MYTIYSNYSMRPALWTNFICMYVFYGKMWPRGPPQRGSTPRGGVRVLGTNPRPPPIGVDPQGAEILFRLN